MTMGGIGPRAVVMAAIGFILALGAVIDPVLAGQPQPWQLTFQEPATPVAREIIWLHDMILWIIVAICVFVLALLLYVMVRFNSKANPEPSRFSHNTTIEIVWTTVPILILLAIGIPSFRLLYFQDTVPEADMTVKVTGYQWYWGYGYPDHGDFEYVSNPIADEDLAAEADYFGNPRVRNLSVDYDMVVPVGQTVKVIVTAADVLHNFAVPAFGLKMDAVPGRLNETWFRVDEPGMYYGQCSEICGPRHAFMPIAIRAVSQTEFENWAQEQAELLAGVEFKPETRLAMAE